MYESFIESIKTLAWKEISARELTTVMILSAYAAREFAESLRIALDLYPDNRSLQEMAREELHANNLRYGDYLRSGDHGDLLWHFIEKYSLLANNANAVIAGENYLKKIRELSPHVRAMSIFSRESELPGIFSKILEAKDWSLPGLPEFRYYITEHIRLDSREGGHADMLAEFEVTDEVTPFYAARLDLYRCIPALFGL